MMTCETFMRISETDSAGTVHTVDIPIDSKHTAQQVFRAALGQAGVSTETEIARIRDGQPAIEYSANPGLWGVANAFLRARDDLRAKMAATSRVVSATPGPASVGD